METQVRSSEHLRLDTVLYSCFYNIYKKEKPFQLGCDFYSAQTPLSHPQYRPCAFVDSCLSESMASAQSHEIAYVRLQNALEILVFFCYLQHYSVDMLHNVFTSRTVNVTDKVCTIQVTIKERLIRHRRRPGVY